MPTTMVSAGEMDTCIRMALDENPRWVPAAACDADMDGSVTIDDLVAGVAAELTACPTPVPVTLDEIQATIFTPRCAIQTCHDSQERSSRASCSSAGVSYDHIVNVPSTRIHLSPCV